MATTPLSDELCLETLNALHDQGTKSDAARALGLVRSTFLSRLDAARRRFPGWRSPNDPRTAGLLGTAGNPPIPAGAVPVPGFVVTHNSGQYDAAGTLQRQFVKTARDTGDIYDIPDGHVVKGESALIDQDGRVRAKWIKTAVGAGEGLIEGLKEAFASYDGAAGIIRRPDHADDDLLTVYPLPDLHFGMYAWGRETGADYDTEIATKTAMECVGDLVGQAKRSRKAVILGLGDYFHANDDKNATPHSGNKLDVDTRWAQVFAAGAKLATALVDMVARKHDEVQVVMLPGNHDPDAAICLTVALSLFYSNTPRISVHQEPGLAWYYHFGGVLLGATHGHTMKPERMAMMLANDRAKEWGLTKFKHFFFGHVHHESALECGPVRVESLSAPAARDAWNQGAGYRSGRALSAITFHRERGEIGRCRVNIQASPVA